MEITAIVKMSQEDPTMISYLRVKAFIPLNPSIKHQIDQVETGDVVYLKGKFIGCQNWYSVCFSPFFPFLNQKKKLIYTSYKVNATSIKCLQLKYDDIPLTGIHVIASSITTDLVR